MRPLWQLYQPCRFGSNLWRCPTSSLFPIPRHPVPAHFTNTRPPHDARYIASTAHQYAMLHNHLASQHLNVAMDKMSLRSETEDANGCCAGKRTYSMMNTPCSASTSGGSSFSSHLKYPDSLTSISRSCEQIHTGTNTSNLSLDANKTAESDSEKQKQQDDEAEKIDKELIIKSYLDLRRWHRVQRNDSTDRQQEFYLVSYNILAQQLLESNDYLYQHCDPEILSWAYRRKNLLNELKNFNSDVVCLQEMQDDHYHNDFRPFLEREGYDSVYKKRTGDKNDGCAIFFKRDVFELEKWAPVEYNKPGVPVLNRDNIGIVALFRPKADKNTSSRLCVATTHLLFNPRRGDVKLAQLQVLLAEIDKMAFKRLGSVGKTRYHPVILCGDMNSEPHCDIYSFVSTGLLNYEGLPVAMMSGQKRHSNTWYLSCELLPPWLGITDKCQYSHSLKERQHGCANVEQSAGQLPNRETPNSGEAKNADCNSLGKSQEDNSELLCMSDVEESFCSGSMLHHLNLMSVYKHELERIPGAYEVTTQHTKASCTVDYIFYSVMKKNSYVRNSLGGKVVHDDVKENNLKLLAYYGLLTGSELRRCGGLPNALTSSDHLPLAAKFSLKL